PNVEEAFICEGYYYVVSSLPGAGSMYRIVDGSTVHCPLVNPVDMSEECRDFMDNPKNCSENVCTGQ
ncbi:hypothetical protein KJ780_02495, partial [Candidatus Micrarchaeota archaeon]|nr:hypothetical protein [Candidatus Micrarchaeota archaeon]